MNKQCKTCPFLEENRGRPTPTDFKCVEENMADWYAQENIDGIWKVMQKHPPAFLSCHSTDPDYYGKEEGQIWACTGVTLLATMHALIFYDAGDYQRYCEIVGKDVALEVYPLMIKAHALVSEVTYFEGAFMKIPANFTFDLKDMRFPTGFEKAVAKFQQLMDDQKVEIT